MCLYARAVGRGRGFNLSIAIQVIDTKPARVASAVELWGLIAFGFAATCHPERYPAKDLGSGIRLLQPRSFAGTLRVTGYRPNRNRTDTSTSRRTQRSTRLYAVAVGHRSGVDHSKTLSKNVGCAGRTSRASGFHLQRSAIELRARDGDQCTRRDSNPQPLALEACVCSYHWVRPASSGQSLFHLAQFTAHFSESVSR